MVSIVSRIARQALSCAVQIKTALIKTGMFEDTIPCHLASGLGAGFFAVISGSPVDVVKSRLMGMPSIYLCSTWRFHVSPSHVRSLNSDSHYNNFQMPSNQ